MGCLKRILLTLSFILIIGVTALTIDLIVSSDYAVWSFVFLLPIIAYIILCVKLFKKNKPQEHNTNDAINLEHKAGVDFWNRNEQIRRMKDVNGICVEQEETKKKSKDKDSDTYTVKDIDRSGSVDNFANKLKEIKHDYKVTVLRYYDNTTYDLHRIAADEEEAVTSVNRVIDTNETVIRTEDCGIYPISR